MLSSNEWFSNPHSQLFGFFSSSIDDRLLLELYV